MNFRRRFVRDGSLWLPNYQREVRYKERHRRVPPLPRAVFSHVQGNSTTSSFSTMSVNVGSNFTPGNLICVGFTVIRPTGTVGTLIVYDGNNNSALYTFSPISPITGETPTTELDLYLVYAVASGSPGSQITVSNGGSALLQDLFVDEFSAGAAAISFDQDAGSTTAPSGTIVNTPSITPSYIGELLYSIAIVNNAVTHPTKGATLAGWTGIGIDAASNAGEYQLSSGAGITTVNYTCTSSVWNTGIMAFQVPGLQPNVLNPESQIDTVSLNAQYQLH